MNNRLFVPQLRVRELTTDEIHIWYAYLDKPVSQFWGLLSMDERRRAGRFHFEEDRRRFIVRQGILRKILGYYLGVEPSRFQFCYGNNGKPALADTFGKGKVRFNSSHSEGLALYAFTRDREIGVDIEHIGDGFEMEQIAEQFFSTREKAIFRALPESKKKRAFFNCWTRKEAFIKATGDGLSLPLDRFDVSLVPGEPARLLGIDGDSKAASRWLLQDLKPAPGFAAAFAVKGQSRYVHCRQYDNEVTELQLDDSKTQQFWEERAKGIGTYESALCSVVVTDDPVWANYRHKVGIEHLFRMVKCNQSMTVLDLGCGIGRFSIEFAKRCKSVLAIDYSPTFIEYAKKAARDAGISNITFLCQPITEYSYLRNLHFDIIHLGGVLMYMNDESIEDLLNQLKYHLRREGLLIKRDTIALQQRRYHTDNTDNPYICRTQGEYLKMFKNNGFALIYRNNVMFPPLPMHLYNKLPLSLKKSRLLKNLLDFSLSICAKMNFILLKQKWIIRLFIDPLTPWRNETDMYCIYCQK